MKTLVDVDEDLLNEARTLAGVPTKKETIRRALQEFIRARRRADLKRMAGSGVVTMTRAELVDTSAWIDFLAGSGQRAMRETIVALLGPAPPRGNGAACSPEVPPGPRTRPWRP